VKGGGRNIGFGAGHNRNAVSAEGEVFVILNPDTSLSAGMLTTWVRFLVDRPPGVSAIAPQLVGDDGICERSCRRFPTLATEVSRAFGLEHRLPWTTLMLDWDHSEGRLVEQPPGAALALTLADYRRIDGFDEKYPLYFEDVDFCRRLWEQSGAILFAPDVRVQHAREGTARVYRSKSTFWIEYSRRIYVRKWFGAAAPTGLVLSLIGCLLRAVVLSLPMRSSRADNRPRAKGYWLASLAWFIPIDKLWRRLML
jgi:GT2 family glycosyltransferase